MAHQSRADKFRRQNEIEMVKFLNRNYVVQAKRKVKGVLVYDIICADGEDVAGTRFVAVPEATIIRLRSASDGATFGDMIQKHAP